MDNRNIKRNVGITVLLLTAVLLCQFPSMASVSFTKETTGPADCVYVAGNPDLYPLERYNRNTGEYEGAATELLRRISDRTGIDFVYIGASNTNRQQKMGENRQAELLTAYTGETGDWCRGEEAVCTFESNGKQYTARFCFSTILPEEEYRKIVDAFYEISGEELYGWTVSYTMEKKKEQDRNPITVASVLFFAAAVVLLAITLFFAHKNRKDAEIEKWLDPLTGKGNRHYFLERFREMVTDATRHSCYLVCYEFDIDWVNRCVGRETAEELLRSMASAFPEDSEKQICCRISGGEFANLIEAPGIETVRELTTRNLRQFNEKAKALTGENGATVNASVLALDSVVCSGKNALKYARHAISMEGGPSVTVCTEESLHELFEDSELLGQVAPALENGEFKVLIQPVFDVKNEQLHLGEVVSRWDHPQRGRLKPSRFLESVREVKLSMEFDCYMLEKTCALLEEQKNSEKTDLSLAVYFCTETILRKDFMDRFMELIQKYTFNHSLLAVIITEEMVEKDPEYMNALIKKLHRYDFRVLLSEFGTGHTSILNLVNLSPDYVKLEKETMTLLKKDRGKQMLSGISGLIHSMGGKVIFQGIETKEQRDDAIECRCDFIQGYYYARPMPPEEAFKRMKF